MFTHEIQIKCQQALLGLPGTMVVLSSISLYTVMLADEASISSIFKGYTLYTLTFQYFFVAANLFSTNFFSCFEFLSTAILM